ncbi:MAG: hypothetical protein ACD_8C00124G0010 [uncultured bacterium]|nr:MAG: hypothetical protein ACD_8C00124G0010 [uncultured bacterium]
MKKKITLQNKVVEYEIKKSKRAKRMRLAVYCEGTFVVTLPHQMNESFAQKLIKEKAVWILDKVAYFKSIKNKIFLKRSESDYKKYKDDALKFAEKRVAHFNQVYKYEINKISIKNQKTRWGSCSRKGNLNFNYKIILLPKKIADYVIVHELCHLKEFNHSRKFWNLVERGIPQYREIIKEINSL